MKNVELGIIGEQHAVNHLIGKGHRIVAQNYRHGRGEIDIVSIIDDVLVVTEVKSRTSHSHGVPELAVNRSKQKQVIKIANGFVAEFDRDEQIRFDVVTIVINRYGVKLEHIEDAFYPIT